MGLKLVSALSQEPHISSKASCLISNTQPRALTLLIHSVDFRKIYMDSSALRRTWNPTTIATGTNSLIMMVTVKNVTPHVPTDALVETFVTNVTQLAEPAQDTLLMTVWIASAELRWMQMAVVLVTLMKDLNRKDLNVSRLLVSLKDATLA